jgi:hypothetical protein
VVPATALGPGSPWAGELSRVLRTPGKWWGHDQFVAVTDQAGDAAVHTAWAEDGLLVTSVAAGPGVPAADVLAAAYPLATAIAAGMPVTRRSLFDLPLGAAPMWEITEQTGQTAARDGREERFTAVLPAWSAHSTHDLSGDPRLGFTAAAATLAALAGLDSVPYQASQAAVARYSRTGFEAAALTWAAAGSALPRTRPGLIRTAELRFGHPFAVVAVATSPQRPGTWHVPGHRWHGLPVFSGWITQPEEAGDAAGPA